MDWDNDDENDVFSDTQEVVNGEHDKQSIKELTKIANHIENVLGEREEKSLSGNQVYMTLPKTCQRSSIPCSDLKGVKISKLKLVRMHEKDGWMDFHEFKKEVSNAEKFDLPYYVDSGGNREMAVNGSEAGIICISCGVKGRILPLPTHY